MRGQMWRSRRRSKRLLSRRLFETPVAMRDQRAAERRDKYGDRIKRG
jgi:hypothetical protein